jgi:hypothetical protein
MQHARKLSFGMLVSVASTVAIVGAPVALAEDGHHGHEGHEDDHVVVIVHNPASPTSTVVSQDVDDVDEHENEVQVQQPQPAMEVEDEMTEDVD